MHKLLYGLVLFSLIAVSTPVWAETENLRSDMRVTPILKEVIKNKIGTKTAILTQFKEQKIAITTGELTAINGITLTIKKDNTSYTILTDDKTKFLRKFWGKSSISEMTVGDKVNIIGKWTDDAKTTIQATFIRDISIQMRHGVFFGTVKSISGNTLVIDTVVRGTQTVTVSDGTKYLNRKQEVIKLTDIVVGNRIRLRGLWNSLKSTITEVTQIKDFSIPEKVAKPSETPSIVPSPTI